MVGSIPSIPLIDTIRPDTFSKAVFSIIQPLFFLSDND